MARDDYQLALQTPQAFEERFRLRYLSNCEFQDEKVENRVHAKCEKALAKGWITPRQKWLGVYFAPSLASVRMPDLSIGWIDEEVGYGVWTNSALKKQTFIGEYTGIIRRRRLWKRWKNLYCFDYTIGPHRSTRLVIDSEKAGNHLRFINHSFSPNLDLVSVYHNGLMRVILYTNQNIKAGSQLFYDYGEEYWVKRNSPKLLSPERP